MMRALGLVVGSLVLGSCCDPYGYDVEDVVVIREDDPVHARAISACFEADFACEPLCVDLIGPPPRETIRSIEECYLDRDGSGGLVVHARSHLVTKCLDDFDDSGWSPGIFPDAGVPDWTVDAQSFDAMEVVDATPPDAEPRDAGP